MARKHSLSNQHRGLQAGEYPTDASRTTRNASQVHQRAIMYLPHYYCTANVPSDELITFSSPEEVFGDAATLHHLILHI